MAVVINNLLLNDDADLGDVKRKISLDDFFKDGPGRGLESLKVLVDPKNRTSVTLVTRWESLRAARAMYDWNPRADEVTTVGEPRILVDAEFLPDE